jgi:hypothetical protein
MRVVPVPGVRDLRLSPTWVDCQLFPMTVVLHSRDLVRILGKLNITDIRSTVRQRVSAFARLSRNAHDAGLWIGVLPEERLHERMFLAARELFPAPLQRSSPVEGDWRRFPTRYQRFPPTPARSEYRCRRDPQRPYVLIRAHRIHSEPRHFCRLPASDTSRYGQFGHTNSAGLQM